MKTWIIRSYDEVQYKDFAKNRVVQEIRLRIHTKEKINGVHKILHLLGMRTANDKKESMQLARDMFMIEPLEPGDEVVVIVGGDLGLFKIDDENSFDLPQRFIVKKWKVKCK